MAKQFSILLFCIALGVFVVLTVNVADSASLAIENEAILPDAAKDAQNSKRTLFAGFAETSSKKKKVLGTVKKSNSKSEKTETKEDPDAKEDTKEDSKDKNLPKDAELYVQPWSKE